ncbi:right-handed parallel beta-helix repeat-containing protein [Rhodophyticola sp. CCM32]|uniref:right-handed parallel beta-helix repeat-containing protein n=1 Tax=Rhodophyticola sp. CCM32 TaxID=2916397 RepID=UPI00143D0DA1|nr:right-handed parallel beta-helix repeat-containing protein [Rhodophyticola sp. CCM32]
MIAPRRIGRRLFIAGLLSSTAGILGPVRGKATPTNPDALHFLPRSQGAGTGATWADAAGFRRASAIAAQAEHAQSCLFGVAEPDLPHLWTGQQMLWGQAGTETDPLCLAFGARDGDGAVHQPQTYTDPPLFEMTGHDIRPGERPNLGGAPFLVFGSDSAHLRISGPVFDRSGGDGFFKIDAGDMVQNLSFSDIHARRAGRVIETERGTCIEGLVVERCTALGLIRGFARFFDLSEAAFCDLDLDADFLDGGGGAVCQIISVTRGHDLGFRNIRLAKAVNTLAAEERGSSYIQGDGIVLEEDTRDVRIADCHAEDMGDGGFDLKSDGVHMTNCTATRCKLGIRIWSHNAGNLIENCTLTEPVSRPFNEGSCLWVAGNLTARDCTLHSTGDMSPIRFGGGTDRDRDATLKIEGGVITHTEGVSLATGTPGEIELVNVRINDTETSGRFYWNGRRLRRRRW